MTVSRTSLAAPNVAECPECRARLDISYRYDQRGRVHHITIVRHCEASCGARPFFSVGAARLDVPSNAHIGTLEMELDWSEEDVDAGYRG